MNGSSKHKRINPVVTGMGCVCAAGKDLQTTWSTMLAGISEARQPKKFCVEIKRLSPVFEVSTEGWKEPAFFPDGQIEKTNCTRFLLAAFAEALQQADLTIEKLRSERTGVCIGTTVGCTLNDEQFYRDYKSRFSPGMGSIKRFLGNNPAVYLGETLALRGPVCTINNACSSGTDAVGQALEWIRDGLCEIVVAGGTDELSRIPYLGFSALLNTSNQPCRPFDAKRDGLNLGEGAGVLIIESKEAANKRGVQALVEIAGYGVCADAYHLTAPHPGGVGLELAIRGALGAVAPGEICLVNAHGTATEANDMVEGSTLARIFGKNITVFGTKSYTGHTLGAAGALEAIFAGWGLVTGRIPPTAGFSEPDPQCVIVPTATPTEIGGDYALSTSLAFGGTNAAVLLKVVKDGD